MGLDHLDFWVWFLDCGVVVYGRAGKVSDRTGEFESRGWKRLKIIR